MKEAVLYQKLTGKKVRCLACQRKCVVGNGGAGFCLARKNIDGKLYSLLYGYTTGIQVDPIEKKPFYHFKPGSLVATIGSVGCNFRCKQCLNSWCTWGPSATETLLQLSSKKQDNKITINNLSPKQLTKEIVNAGYSGIAFSYNEPVIWTEFCADTAREFKSRSPSPSLPIPDSQPTSHNSPLFAVFVTNGSWTKETIDYLSSPSLPTPDLPAGRHGPQPTTHPHSLIDAANIDFKGFSEETYQKMGAFFGEIPEMAVYAKKKNIFLEITTLVIPKINDDWEEIKKMTNFIAHKLGPDTPWHLSEYDPNLAPDPEFQKLPFTPPELLQKFMEIGKAEGLNHIYIWAPHSGFSISDTLCPKCKKNVVKRAGWTPVEISIKLPNSCLFCGYKLNLIL